MSRSGSAVELNRNAVHAAANRLVRKHGMMEVPPVVKERVAQLLVELYGVIGDPPPPALRDLAGGTLSAGSPPPVGGLDVSSP